MWKTEEIHFNTLTQITALQNRNLTFNIYVYALRVINIICVHMFTSSYSIAQKHNYQPHYTKYRFPPKQIH